SFSRDLSSDVCSSDLMFSPIFFTMFYVQLWYYPSAAFWAMFIGGLTIFLAGYYNYLIFAPTEKGQQTTSAIKGFRMYLDKSEKRSEESRVGKGVGRRS